LYHLQNDYSQSRAVPEPIPDTDTNNDLPAPAMKWRLKFEPGDEENENLAPLEMIELCVITYPVLLTTRHLLVTNSLEAIAS